MPSKVWERTKVVFAPTGRIPSFRRLAPWPFLWLSCWSVSCTPTLDTQTSTPQLAKCGPRNFSTVDQRDGYLLDCERRRESGEDKREFDELLRQDWRDLERRRKR